MIVDLATKKIIYASQPDLVRPMASITKVMTAMVVLDAHLPLDEMLTGGYQPYAGNEGDLLPRAPQQPD